MSSLKPIKVAVVTEGISHFEVPLYRLCSQSDDIDLRVFYLLKTEGEGRYCKDYQKKITWGEDMLSGYVSELCSCAKELRKEVYRWEPDVAMVYGYSWQGAIPFIISNRLRNIPQIHRGTLNYYKDPRRGVKADIMRPFRNIVFNLFQAHHYGGSYSKKVLKHAGISEKQMFFVPYSVDTHFFLNESDKEDIAAQAAKLRDSLGWGNDAKIALFICQHNWFKGPDIAMQVFSELQAQYPQMKALIVGSGRMTEEMKQSAKQNLISGSYFFAGFCPSKETVKYYLASDAVLFTSRYETWARAVNEAMLCKKICVVNDHIPSAGGLVDNEKNGYVVPGTDDIEVYVSALKHYFLLPEQDRKAMAEQARLKACEFSYEKNLDELRKSILFAAK